MGKRSHTTSHVSAPPICVDCQRLRKAVYGKWGMFCDAFPEGIPDAIRMTRVDHRRPYTGDHDLQFLARSPAAEVDAARLIHEAHLSTTAPLGDLALDNDWLYAWGDLPTNLPDLKAWLKAQRISVRDFKNSARYEANYDRFPWLKDL
jgi:hypothetical protein